MDLRICNKNNLLVMGSDPQAFRYGQLNVKHGLIKTFSRQWFSNYVNKNSTCMTHFILMGNSKNEPPINILTQTRKYIMTLEGHTSSSTEWILMKLQKYII